MASTPTTNTSGTSSNGANFRGPFAIMTSLFFLWGFMTVFNDILIPRFREQPGASVSFESVRANTQQ